MIRQHSRCSIKPLAGDRRPARCRTVNPSFANEWRSVFTWMGCSGDAPLKGSYDFFFFLKNFSSRRQPEPVPVPRGLECRGVFHIDVHLWPRPGSNVKDVRFKLTPPVARPLFSLSFLFFFFFFFPQFELPLKSSLFFSNIFVSNFLHCRLHCTDDRGASSDLCTWANDHEHNTGNGDAKKEKSRKNSSRKCGKVKKK